MAHRRRGLLTAAVLTALTGCISQGGGTTQTAPADVASSTIITFPPPGTGRMTVSWAANIEAAVNRSGGGYRVYYSADSRFPEAETRYKDVPYVSGGSAPTSTAVTDLSAGRYYVRVAAFSAITSPSTGERSLSAPSAGAAVTVTEPAGP